MLVTKKDKIPIAIKSTRIVHGGRGDYVEIANEDMIIQNLKVPDSQKWRLNEYWQTRIFYEWYVPKYGDQIKLVDYADYKIGYWYVDPTLVEENDD
jgi:hypothetical protein